MVLGYPQVFDESILLRFFYTMHFISMLGKEAKSWFYIESSIYTNNLVY